LAVHKKLADYQEDLFKMAIIIGLAGSVVLLREFFGRYGTLLSGVLGMLM